VGQQQKENIVTVNKTQQSSVFTTTNYRQRLKVPYKSNKIQ